MHQRFVSSLAVVAGAFPFTGEAARPVENSLPADQAVEQEHVESGVDAGELLFDTGEAMLALTLVGGGVARVRRGLKIKRDFRELEDPAARVQALADADVEVSFALADKLSKDY